MGRDSGFVIATIRFSVEIGMYRSLGFVFRVGTWAVSGRGM